MISIRFLEDVLVGLMLFIGLRIARLVNWISRLRISRYLVWKLSDSSKTLFYLLLLRFHFTFLLNIFPFVIHCTIIFGFGKE